MSEINLPPHIIKLYETVINFIVSKHDINTLKNLETDGKMTIDGKKFLINLIIKEDKEE